MHTLVYALVGLIAIDEIGHQLHDVGNVSRTTLSQNTKDKICRIIALESPSLP
jgi:hypothetical protein